MVSIEIHPMRELLTSQHEQTPLGPQLLISSLATYGVQKTLLIIVFVLLSPLAIFPRHIHYVDILEYLSVMFL